MATKTKTTTKGYWRRNRSAVPGYIKKPEDPALSDYFYTGPSWHFGHFPCKKHAR